MASRAIRRASRNDLTKAISRLTVATGPERFLRIVERVRQIHGGFGGLWGASTEKESGHRGTEEREHEPTDERHRQEPSARPPAAGRRGHEHRVDVHGGARHLPGVGRDQGRWSSWRKLGSVPGRRPSALCDRALAARSVDPQHRFADLNAVAVVEWRLVDATPIQKASVAAPQIDHAQLVPAEIDAQMFSGDGDVGQDHVVVDAPTDRRRTVKESELLSVILAGLNGQEDRIRAFTENGRALVRDEMLLVDLSRFASDGRALIERILIQRPFELRKRVAYVRRVERDILERMNITVREVTVRVGNRPAAPTLLIEGGGQGMGRHRRIRGERVP